jgi:hypothetical protein
MTGKSKSLQALVGGVPPVVPVISPAATNTNVSSTNTDSRSAPKYETAKQIGGKFSMDLASTANNSVRGSKSSGLVFFCLFRLQKCFYNSQDLGSEAQSASVAIDTAISHHHNAASLTRFDTDHKDFDQRLAQVQHILQYVNLIIIF